MKRKKTTVINFIPVERDPIQAISNATYLNVERVLRKYGAYFKGGKEDTTS